MSTPHLPQPMTTPTSASNSQQTGVSHRAPSNIPKKDLIRWNKSEPLVLCNLGTFKTEPHFITCRSSSCLGFPWRFFRSSQPQGCLEPTSGGILWLRDSTRQFHMACRSDDAAGTGTSSRPQSALGWIQRPSSAEKPKTGSSSNHTVALPARRTNDDVLSGSLENPRRVEVGGRRLGGHDY